MQDIRMSGQASSTHVSPASRLQFSSSARASLPLSLSSAERSAGL